MPITHQTLECHITAVQFQLQLFKIELDLFLWQFPKFE